MSARALTLGWAALLAVAVATKARSDVPAAAPATTARAPASGAAHGLTDTRCAGCHSVDGWKPVKFDHTRTGFTLRGAHAQASCSACHGSDLSRAVPQSCTACHQDAHTGEFGARCQGCHDERSWRPLFNADAHRRTNFPLTGRHALLACEACHQNQRDRTFTRATVDCISCHQRDYARTGSFGIDHAAAGFATSCRDCHLPYRWQGAHFAEHEACFEISGGPHANIACLSCHTAMPQVAGAHGACNTNNASCTRCHSCSSVDGRHARVDGYQCKDRKCWECHRFSSSQVPTRPLPGGARR